VLIGDKYQEIIISGTLWIEKKYKYKYRKKISGRSLHIIPTKGCAAMAFFASSVIGSFSTVCVSPLTPNAVDKITSMVRL